jgi:hypothetical protein
MMLLQNPYFDGITNLPDYTPSREIFYFSNLNADIEDNRNYLNDHLATKRLGDPIKNITTSTFNYKFKNPVSAAQFELTDLFGNELELPNPEFSFSEAVNSYQHEMNKIKGIKSGRYIITDNHGGELPLYYDTNFYGKDIFGVIEIYNNTLDFSDPPGTIDLVPDAYKMAENDRITGKGSYFIGFAPSERKWMYVCRKNPNNSGNDIEVINLEVDGPVDFAKSGGDDVEERQILSKETIVSSEEPIDVELLHNTTKIMDLPNPSMGRILKKNDSDTYYEMYIYV